MAMPGRGGILTCHIESMEMLYASYLSFVTNGALFVSSERVQKLGDEVFIAVTLPNSSERLPMNGKVVWVNSKAQSGRPAGLPYRLVLICLDSESKMKSNVYWRVRLIAYSLLIPCSFYIWQQ